jgi:hypothetical protein
MSPGGQFLVPFDSRCSRTRPPCSEFCCPKADGHECRAWSRISLAATGRRTNYHLMDHSSALTHCPIRVGPR